MATLVAVQHNHPLKKVYLKLKKEGKKPKIALHCLYEKKHRMDQCNRQKLLERRKMLHSNLKTVANNSEFGAPNSL